MQDDKILKELQAAIAKYGSYPDFCIFAAMQDFPTKSTRKNYLNTSIVAVWLMCPIYSSP